MGNAEKGINIFKGLQSKWEDSGIANVTSKNMVQCTSWSTKESFQNP